MICACPFCFTAVENRGDYCADCLDVHCSEVFAPRSVWTYDWPHIAEALFRVRRFLQRARVITLTIVRWLFAYDQCCGCRRWRPRSETDVVQFTVENPKPPCEQYSVDFIFCEQCRRGRNHEQLKADVIEWCSTNRESEEADAVHPEPQQER